MLGMGMRGALRRHGGVNAVYNWLSHLCIGGLRSAECIQEYLDWILCYNGQYVYVCLSIYIY
jgi:hypothetical protein